MLEGIIKFRIDFIRTDPTIFSSFSELNMLRQWLFERGYIGISEDGVGYGNVSSLSRRSWRKPRFYITGSQTGGLSELTSAHYALIEDYSHDEFAVTARGPLRPSSESLTHAAIYELDSSIRSVVHIHNRPLWEKMIEDGHLSTGDHDYGSSELAREIRSIYKGQRPLEHKTIVMPGHEGGILTFGRNCPEARSALTALEERYGRHFHQPA